MHVTQRQRRQQAEPSHGPQTTLFEKRNVRQRLGPCCSSTSMSDRRRVQDFAAVTSRSTEQGRCLDVSLQLVQAEEDRGPLVCLVLKAQRQILQVNIWNLMCSISADCHLCRQLFPDAYPSTIQN